MSEFYKIPNFSNYQISKCGLVINSITKRKISIHLNSNGYYAVNIKCDDGKRKLTSIHRLIAFTFIPNPENKPQVNHKDGNKLNNSIENLEWSTLEENINHAISNGLLPNYKSNKRVNCTYSNNLRAKVKDELLEVISRNGVSKWLLKRIIFEDI